MSTPVKVETTKVEDEKDQDLVQIEVEPETKLRFLAEMKKYGFTKEEDFMEALVTNALKSLPRDPLDLT